MPSHLFVALARRGLFGEAHAAQERVLAELTLHCEHGSLQVVFALIGRQGHPPVFIGDRYKTSLALFLQVDRAGTLNMILSEFAYAGINLTMLQSRPTKKQLGDYMFFVELDGSMHDIDVQTALDCLRLKLREVKVFGSYPVE